jgi:hypothetical protein
LSQISFLAGSVGVNGPAYVYDYFGNTGTVIQPGGEYRTLVDYDGSYYLVAPIGPSGIAFLGDSGKFISCGKKRIEQLSDNGTLRVLVRFAPGEAFVALRLYSATEPTVSADSGAVGRVHHHGDNLYRVVVQPDANGAAALTFQVAAAAQA